MDTNNLKRFATAARTILKQGVINKFLVLGFDAEGNVKPENEPQPVQGGVLFKGQVIDDPAFYPRWQSLRHRVSVRGIRDVYEEAAYTWFNRFMAISILQHNDLMAPALQFESADVRIPLVVGNARRGLLPTMTDADRTRLSAIINDDNLTTEQFAILITSLCQFTPILKACFGGITDYTALLLPDDILAKDGFIDMLNHTSFITEEDYRQSELIGWLYQFYISERKDEVFAGFKSGRKAEAEDIPAATQIFTPNWIVKYMVQNTLGRIYLDNNPDCSLKSSWQFFVDSPSERGQGGVLKLQNLEDYTFADLSCGSGHILGEAFDLLYALYQQEFYSPREAITAIFTRNLTGVDIDTRARQLSCFALLLKACQIDNTFSNAQVLPRVLDMPEPYTANDLQTVLTDYLVDSNPTTNMEVANAIELMKHAYNLGSIMKFELSNESRAVIARCTEEWEKQSRIPDEIQNMMHYMRILLALTKKYAAIAMNPPYMNSNNMNDELAIYVRNNYNEGKADLMTVFMQVAENSSLENGMWSMINLPSWMFLPSFESIRIQVIDHQYIQSLIYMGRGVFGSDFGSVAFAMRNNNNNDKNTICRKLFKTQGLVRSNDEIKSNFFNPSFGYFIVNQKDFHKIPGCPLAFWLPSKVMDAFENRVSIYGVAKKGLSTGDNNQFLRLWFEVSQKKSVYNATNFDNEFKWYPINKGGAFRKWYGNNEFVINWYHNGEQIRNFGGSVIRNPQYYLKPCITWTMLSASCFGVRFSNNGKLFEGAGPSLFIENSNLNYILGFLCSNLADMVLRSLNPTINININDVLNLPIITSELYQAQIEKLVENNIAISKQDWDAHETSWDFQENELIRLLKKGLGTFKMGFENAEKTNYVSLEMLVEEYKAYWDEQFEKLHENEEQLNQKFIEIYGLQDELSCEVPEDEVTILQQGEIDFIPAPGSDNWMTPRWLEDNIIGQLISYAVGCYMGRYRLDRPGLHIAHPNPSAEELQPYPLTEQLNNSQLFTIDEDAIIPILPRDCGFPDNLLRRITNFIEQVFGSNNLVANLNYIESALGKSLEDYLSKDFWKDHVKRYQKRPIYWLFSSKKGAFKAIAYMHRMDAFTVATIRNHYLLPYINTLETRIDALRVRQAELTTPERRNLERLTKDLDDCREYDLRLHQVADRQITFDLDDGVVHNYALFGDVLSKL